MKKVLLLLYVLTIVFAAHAADDTLKLYQYVGNTIKVNNRLGNGDLYVRKGALLYLAEHTDSDAATVHVVVDGENAFCDINSSQLGKEHWYDLFMPVDKKKEGGYKKAYSFLKISPVSDSVCLVQNVGKDTVDILDNGILSRTLAPNDEMSITRKDNADSLGLMVTGGQFVPSNIKAKFKEKEPALSKLDIILIVVIALLAILLVVFAVVNPLRNGSSAKVGKSKGDNKRLNPQDFSIKTVKKKYAMKYMADKKERCVFQKVRISTKPEEASDYIGQLAENYYQQYKEKTMQWLEDNVEDGTINAPVFFSESGKVNVTDDFVKVKIDGKKYWVRPIPPYQPSEKKKTSNESLPELKQLVDEFASLSVQSQESGQPAESEADGKGSLINIDKVQFDGLVERLRKSALAIEDSYASASSVGEKELREIEERHRKELDDALARQKKDNDNALKSLQTKLAEQDARYKDELGRQKTQFDKDKKKITKDAQEAISKAKDEAAKEMKDYRKRLKFYVACQPFASKVVALFDTVNTVKGLANKFYDDYISTGKDVDAFCYYFARIENKYRRELKKIENLDSFVYELYMLSKSGMVPTGGLVDSMLSEELDQKKWDDVLRMRLYNELLMAYGSCAIIMTDEFAYQIPAMANDAGQLSEATEIAGKTTELVKQLETIGYEVNYVKPFTPISQYDDVANTQFVDIGVEKGTIFEVTKIAVNYGFNKSKTEVHAQK